MARERLVDQQARLAAADVEFRAVVGKKLNPKKRPRPAISAKGWETARALVDERLVSCDWEGASPAEWVALHSRLYAKVYGLENLELADPKMRAVAARLAKKLRGMVGAEGGFFADDAAFVDYIRWAWLRESDREEWRRENGGKGGQLHWRNLFGLMVLEDYRREQVRKAAK